MTTPNAETQRCCSALLTTASLTGCGGEVGPEPEDFKVDEVPLYAASGTGEHLYLRVKKTGRTTQQLVSAIAGQAGIRPRDVGYAGLKDKHAITTQWLSFLDRGTPPPTTWQLDPEYEVLELSRHNNKLRTGHLAGNRFELRIVGAVSSEGADAVVAALSERGLLNYFGVQRFGYEGRNLEQAWQWAVGLVTDAAQPRGRRGGRQKVRFEQKLFPSVLQSEVFNRYINLRRDCGLHRLIPGEVVRLSGSSKVFVVTDPDAEQHRLDSGDVHLTGPMFGPKMRLAEGQALELESEALGSLGLRTEVLKAIEEHAPGTRRDLLVTPEGLEVEHTSADTFTLRFSLQSGSYATQVVREFCSLRVLEDEH